MGNNQSKELRLHVIIYTATWCKRCQNLKELYNNLKNMYCDTYSFNEIDIDDENNISFPDTIPCVYIYNNFGKTILSGQEEIEQSIEMILDS